MYCPKCGTENAETNNFCRACRENLKVVSQAMMQRLPVVLASRFDQMLDSRSERFRRDSILGFLLGLLFFAGGLPEIGATFIDLILLGFSCYYFLFGFWSYLAYRRSLAPDFDWGMSNERTINVEPFDKCGPATLDILSSHTENEARTANKRSPQST
jgi:hypothetical protein